MSEDATGPPDHSNAHGTLWLDTPEGWAALLQPDDASTLERGSDASSRPQSLASSATLLGSDRDSLLTLNTAYTPGAAPTVRPREFVEAGGRKYQRYRPGNYILPNDEEEQYRLELQHVMFKILFRNSLFVAPIKDPKAILDIGTGTGNWAMEMAEQFPDANVYGTDLCSIQTDAGPPNCKFIVEDAEDEWLFDSEGPFDYIHGRALIFALKDHQAVIQKAYDNLRPGGWLEFQDAHPIVCSDDGSSRGTSLERVAELLVAAGRAVASVNNSGDYANASTSSAASTSSGSSTPTASASAAASVSAASSTNDAHHDDGNSNRHDSTSSSSMGAPSPLGAASDYGKVTKYKNWMADVGFDPVVQRKFKLPGNAWPRDHKAKMLGIYQTANLTLMLPSLTRIFTRTLNMPPAEVAALTAQAQRDVANPAIHFYMEVYSVYGQKRLDAK